MLGSLFVISRPFLNSLLTISRPDSVDSVSSQVSSLDFFSLEGSSFSKRNFCIENFYESGTIRQNVAPFDTIFV